MEEFQNTVDPKKFRATNAVWNELTLNSPWSVGYVTSLILAENFKTKEDWEAYYYRSGEERDAILKGENDFVRNFMNDHTLQKTKPGNIEITPVAFRKLNFNYGRTKTQFREKGEILFQKMNGLNVEISLEECVEAVRHRVIGETWNGIMIREKNTLIRLMNLFPEIIFIKPSGDFDHLYAVDFQLFIGSKMICGIQIKPKSYTGNTDYIQKAKKVNEMKNKLFTKTFDAPVFYIFSKSSGEILNRDSVKQIEEISKSLVN